MGDTEGPRYTAPKISAISYLFRTFSLLIMAFSLLIMGDTERPRYTGFRGLSVRGITALQCSRIPRHCKFTQHLRSTRPPPADLRKLIHSFQGGGGGGVLSHEINNY